MGRLIVITTPDAAPGFQLAGVETFAAEGGAQAEAVLRELLQAGDASLIAMRQELLQAIDPRLQRQIETHYPPVVIAIPGGAPTMPAVAHRHAITELIRQAIGFHITFGAGEPQGPAPS